MNTDSPIGNRMLNMYNLCIQNEKNYLEIKKSNGILSGAYDHLNQIDSNQICDYVQANNLSITNCSTAFNGLIGLGMNAIIQSYLTYFYQERIQYMSVPPENRTVEYLRT